MSINPFDDGSFFVLVNDDIEQNWPDIRPKSLRDRLAEARGLEL